MLSYVIQPPSHWLYHLANIFLLFSYLSPNLLVLRILLAAGCLCFALWGLLVLAISIDTTVYNGFFFLINTAHALYLVYQLRPVEVDSELEAVWRAMFDGKDGLVMNRRDWKKLTEKDVVQSDGHEVLLHELHAMEWIDSPEYVARQTPRGATFQVRIRALPAIHDTLPSHRSDTANPALASSSLTMSSVVGVDACRVLVLPYSALERVYGKLPHLRGAIDCVVARDVVHKLFATGEAVRGVQKLSATISEHVQRADTEQLSQQQAVQKDEEERKELGG